MVVILGLSKLLARQSRGRLMWDKSRLLCGKVSFSKTLNLPKSDFPMKHSRALELKVEQTTKFADLYHKQLDFTSGSYTLHDGPPYANGDVHFGHSINKILKDIIIKRKMLENMKVNYVPGWDCHGLPIELKAISEDESVRIEAEEIRKRAEELALSAIDLQRSSFEQWSLSADFRSPYLTFQPEFIVNQLRAFHKLYKNGLIFRDYMPVYYSPSTRTALAEAELQYNHQHISLSAFVKYPLLKNDAFHKIFDDSSNKVNALIWTTTPWTLLANEAIAVGNSFEYSLIRIDGKKDELFIVAKDLVSSLQEKFKTGITIERIIPGTALVGLEYEDPVRKNVTSLNSSSYPIISSQHVSITKGGTGMVHMAPNHGFDDYKVFQAHSGTLKYKRESIVNEDGKLMVKELMHPPVDIIQNNEASKFVIDKLFQEQIILVEDHPHSYPYDWRSGKPVIVKPSSQWFLRIDSIRSQCLEELSKVKILPEKMRKDFVHHLTHRPNWCLSRQRKWGVPIPVFYSRKNDPDCIHPILEQEAFEKVIEKIQQEGSCDFWWRKNEVPANFCSDRNRPEAEDWVKGTDILDIWFDSGISWLTVLGEKAVADMYLEGIDQIRGWFQSSLITSVALRGYAPYKTLMIHGFALDKEGKKMSKSLGNVIRPIDIIDAENILTKASSKSKGKKVDKKQKLQPSGCGIDGLRFWIAKNACTHNDCHVDMEQFQTDTLTILNRLRNTLKFMLAYIGNDKNELNILDREQWSQMPIMDKFLLFNIRKFNQQCDKFYHETNFGDVCERVNYHVLFEIASFYITRAKDRLYCSLPTSLDYRSALTVLHYAYHSIGFQLSPIIPHIMQEANHSVQFRLDQVLNEKCFSDDEEIFKYLFSEQFDNVEDLEETMRFLFKLIDSEVNPLTTSQNITQLQGIIEKIPSEKLLRQIKKISQKDMNELFQLAHVHVENSCEIDQKDEIEKPIRNSLESDPLESQISDQVNEVEEESIEPKRMRFEKVAALQCGRCRLFNVLSEDSKNIETNTNLCSRCSACLRELDQSSHS